MGHKADAEFVGLAIAVLTVSDTRTSETDTSGQLLVDRCTAAGHSLAQRVLLKDDLYRIRAQVATWIAEDAVQVVIITGGTGFTGRDSTPEAVAVCWTSRWMVLASCSGRSPWWISAPRPSSREPWPVWPMARWCAACRARPMPVAPPGTASSPSSWMPGTGRAISCRISRRLRPVRAGDEA
jgi:hypothetical protein